MRNFIPLLFLLFYSSVCAQTGAIIDSLKRELRKEQADTTRALVLNDLAYYYLYQNTDTAVYYGHEAYDFADKIGFHTVRANAKLYTGNAYLFTNRADSAEVLLQEAYAIAETHKLKKSAIYSAMGMLYKSRGDYEKATQIYYDGIADDEQSGNEYGKFIKLNNLANVYSILEDEEKAIELLKEAVEISKRSENPNVRYALGTILNGIGACYSKLERHDEAIDYFEQSLAANLASDNEKEISRNYQNLGASHRQKGDFQKSLTYLWQALSIRKELDNNVELAETYSQLGATHGMLKRKDSTELYYKEAMAYAAAIPDNALIAEIHLEQSNTYAHWNDSPKALESFKLHTKFRDSVLSAERLENIAEVETKYETAKKDADLLAQRLELEKSSNRIQSRNGLIISLVVVLGLLAYVFRQRQKRKDQEIDTLKREHKIKTLESLIKGEEKERLRIAKELHDGVNGDLSAIKFKLTPLLQDENSAVAEAVHMIDNSCKQVRSISHNLVPPSLENFNLAEALSEYCENKNAVHETEIDFQHLGDHVALSKNVEVNLYRIVQELVTNALKHAQATTINVQLSAYEGEIQLTIEDDGVGFDPQSDRSKGIGLENIQSRIEYLRAEKDVISNDQGTSYTLTLSQNNLP